MDLYLSVSGGLGKHVSALRALRTAARIYDNIYVCSPYYDLFKSAEYISGVYKPEEMRDFLFDAVENSDSVLRIDHMYDMDRFIRKELNYKDAWGDIVEVEVDDDDYNKLTIHPLTVYPDLQNQVDEVMKAVSDGGFEDFVIVQFWGGQSPLGDPNAGYTLENEPLKRSYPVHKAQAFVDEFILKHPKTMVVHYALDNEPTLEGTYKKVIPYLAYYLLSAHDKCRGVISIDSSLPHITTGNCKVVTVWGHTLPDSFGYSCNKNIIQKCRRNDILYFTGAGPSGARIDYIEPKKFLKEVDDYLFEGKDAE